MVKKNDRKSKRKLEVKASVQTVGTHGKDKPSIVSRRTRSCHYFKNNWIAITALTVSIIVAGIHFNQYQIFRPQTELTEVDNQLTLLNKRLVDLEGYFSETPTALTIMEQQDIVSRVELLLRNAESARMKRDVADATLSIIQANEIIDQYLPFEVPVQPGQISVQAVPSYISVSFNFPENIVATNTLGQLVTDIIIVADSAPDYAYKEYYNILSLDVGPAGTVFNQPVEMTFSYLTDNIPKGTKEEDLIMGIWDDSSRYWEILASYVDTDSHTIVTTSNHLGLFSILAPRSLN